MSGETDEKATKVFPKFWRPGSQAVSALPVRTARTTRAQDTIAAPLDHYTRQATASRPVSRYLAPNDKVAEPTSRFLMAARAALR